MLVPLHGLASRHDLPLPFGLVLLGAAVALLVSFVLLIFAWRTPRYARGRALPLRRLSRLTRLGAVRWPARLIILALYALVALALFAGPDRATNPVFAFVYAVMWVGLVPLSLLAGPVWRGLNPLRTVHELLSRLARIPPETGLAPLPRGIGIRPAAVGLFGFAWLELVQPANATLPVLRVWALVWLVGGILGAVVFGRRWLAAADPFEVYATSVSHLSWLRRGRVAGGQGLEAIGPIRNLSAWQAPPGTTAVVSVLLGSTAYDSFAGTTWWIRTSQSGIADYEVLATIALTALIAVVYVTFTLACWAMRPFLAHDAGARHRLATLPRLMAPSVIPIVVGYAIAHYFSFLWVYLQQFWISLSDPLGLGWNLFGTAELGVNSALLDLPGVIAWIQLAGIVLGHVVGIVVAHERALGVLRPDAAVIGQVPMLLVMIGYTCAGLLLLFSP